MDFRRITAIIQRGRVFPSGEICPLTTRGDVLYMGQREGRGSLRVERMVQGEGNVIGNGEKT